MGDDNRICVWIAVNDTFNRGTEPLLCLVRCFFAEHKLVRVFQRRSYRADEQLFGHNSHGLSLVLTEILDDRDRNLELFSK